MTLSAEKFENIKKRYKSFLIIDGDVESAFNFVLDVLSEEIEALEAKCPYATHTINELESAVRNVQSIAYDVEDDVFDEN